jgi:hypothetical protein
MTYTKGKRYETAADVGADFPDWSVRRDSGGLTNTAWHQSGATHIRVNPDLGELAADMAAYEAAARARAEAQDD